MEIKEVLCNNDTFPVEEMQNLSFSDDSKENLINQRLRDLFKDYFLSEMQSLAAFKFIKDKFTKDSSDADRVKKWVMMKLNYKHIPEIYHPRQLGCPDLVPGLTIKSFWEPSEFEWINELVKNVEVIKTELINLREEIGFQPYKSPKFASEIKSKDNLGSLAHDKGDWNVFYLFLHDLKFEENCLKCPKTVELIQKLVPRQYYHAFFSAVAPGTHIIPHNGPTNRKLRLHLPLVNVEGSRLRAGDDIIYMEENKPFIFDDSFNHEAWHDGEKTRINLILDFWHPDLSDSEVKFFKMLQQSRLKNGRKYLEILGKGAEDDNYFDIIEKSKEILKNNDWWVG